MRRYETIFIANPDLSDNDVNGVAEKIKGIIEKTGGHLEKMEDWGTRKLAYEIKKKPRGHYIYLKFSGTSDLIAEVERTLRINEGVIKFQSVQVEEEKTVVKEASAPSTVEVEVAAEA